MTRFTLVNCAVLILIYLELALCSQQTNVVAALDKQRDDEVKLDNLWFGPRLGRRKRNDNEDHYNYLNAEQIQNILEAIEQSPYTIVILNPTKRHTVNFAPRLGRDSGEDDNNEWVQESDLLDKNMNERSPPFAPRLGKRLIPFAQHLSREKYKF